MRHSLLSAGSTPDARRWSDDRGVSTVLGALLLAGLLMLLLVSVQSTAVSLWNEDVEFQHDGRAQNSLSSFHDDIIRSSTQRTDYSNTIELGVRYPTRPFLMNPPDATGNLRTLQNGTVTLSNATATGEAGDYFDGTELSFTTRTVAYEANYNEYQNAPRYLIDNGGLVEQHGDADLPGSESMLVDGKQINLVLVYGSLSQTGVRDMSVMTHAISPSTDRTAVSNENAPIEITVPTAASQAYWEDALADEMESAGGYIISIGVTEGQPYNMLTLKLQPSVTYRLRTAEVGVGGDDTDSTQHYLTRGDSGGTSSVGQYRELEFRVRDQFTNPVADVDVQATVVDGPGKIISVNDRSAEDGTVSYRYTSEEAGTATIRATFGSNPGALETAEHSITVDRGAEATVTDGCILPQWTASDSNVRLTNAQEGCVWNGIDSASTLELSDPYMTPITGADEEFNPKKQYFRLGFIVESSDTTYYVGVTRATDLAGDVIFLGGLQRSYGGSWSDRNVQVYRRVGDQAFELRGEGKLNSADLENWYQGTSSLDLFNQAAYGSGNAGTDELQRFMNGRTVSIRFVEFHGATTVKAT